jgi:hypothetical protein
MRAPCPTGPVSSIRQRLLPRTKRRVGTRVTCLKEGDSGPPKQEILLHLSETCCLSRFVGNIGDTYGSALLLHMLTSTVTLTLLAYQATKVCTPQSLPRLLLDTIIAPLWVPFTYCAYMACGGIAWIQPALNRLFANSAMHLLVQHHFG